MKQKTLRRAPDQLVTVQLSCVELDNVPIMTWLLIGGGKQGFTCREISEIDSAVFRDCLAFMDIHRNIEMDHDKTRSEHTSPLYTIGPITFGEYRIDINRRHCSCPSYKWHNNQNGDRNCKHLNTLCAPCTVVEYTKQPQPFQLISETVPERSVYHDWIFSQKYDGIRVKVEGTVGWTRGGMKIDLSSIWTPPPGYVYDCELCIVNPKTSTHDFVLACVLAGKITCLHLMVFDIMDDDQQAFHRRLACLTGLGLPESNMVQYEMVDNGQEGPSFIDRLSTMKIGSRSCEGVVVRNLESHYDGSGHRSNTDMFKIKRNQWASIKGA